MFKFIFSGIASVLLFYVQSLIVIRIDHYDAIQFDNFTHVAVVCIINFFLSFAILTQLQPYLVKLNQVETDQDE